MTRTLAAVAALLALAVALLLPWSKIRALYQADENFDASNLRPSVAVEEPCRILERAATAAEGAIARVTESASEDEIVIWRSVLRNVDGRPDPIGDVSRNTFPLPLSRPHCECLKHFEAKELSKAARSVRALPPDLLPAKSMRFSEHEARATSGRSPGPTAPSRLFSVSEVVFDSPRQHALVSYEYNCGPLCGYAGVILFEKGSNGWRGIENCGFVIS